MRSLYKTLFGIFAVTISALSGALAQEFHVISPWSPNQMEVIKKYRESASHDVHFNWDFSPLYRYTGHYKPHIRDDELRTVTEMLVHEDKIFVLPDATTAFSLLQHGDSRLAIQGIALPITGAPSATSFTTTDYANDAYYEAIDAYFVVISTNLQNRYGRELVSLEEAVFESDDSILNQMLLGDKAEYFRLEDQTTTFDYLRGYQDILSKKGCGCGPSSSCYSLTLENFAEYLFSKGKDKPRCPKPPPSG